MAAETHDNDRRRFLSEAFKGIGTVAVNPLAGGLAVLMGGGALKEAAARDERSRRDGQGGFAFTPLADIAQARGVAAGFQLAEGLHLAPLLRSGEAVNTRGEPLGDGITALCALDVGDAVAERLVLVAAHGAGPDPCLRPRVGLSTLEIMERGGQVRHDLVSPRNRRYGLAATGVLTETPRTDGGFDRADGAPLAPCLDVIATPWGTALALEETGALAELAPRRELLLRRGGLGAHAGARQVDFEAQAGRPLTLRLTDDQGAPVAALKTRAYFDGRVPASNVNLLAAATAVSSAPVEPPSPPVPPPTEPPSLPEPPFPPQSPSSPVKMPSPVKFISQRGAVRWALKQSGSSHSLVRLTADGETHIAALRAAPFSAAGPYRLGALEFFVVWVPTADGGSALFTISSSAAK